MNHKEFRIFQVTTQPDSITKRVVLCVYVYASSGVRKTKTRISHKWETSELEDFDNAIDKVKYLDVVASDGLGEIEGSCASLEGGGGVGGHVAGRQETGAEIARVLKDTVVLTAPTVHDLPRRCQHTRIRWRPTNGLADLR